jgi:hypothetical protein
MVCVLVALSMNKKKLRTGFSYIILNKLAKWHLSKFHFYMRGDFPVLCVTY